MDSPQASNEETQQNASPVDQGIVSVNRHVSGMNQTARISVLIVMAIVVVLGLVFTANTLNAKRKAEATKEEQAMKVENKPAQVGLRRVFETDPLPPQQTAALVQSTGKSPATSADHARQSPLDRAVDDGSRRMALTPDQTAGTPSLSRRASSRFGGDVIVANSPASNIPQIQQVGTGPDAAISLVRELLTGARPSDTMGSESLLGGSVSPVSTAAETGSSTPASIGYMGGPSGPSIGVTSVGLAAPPGPAASGAGPISGLLTPSDTPKVQAGLLGDRNLIVPKGRTIDCALTVRVINEVAGMATCVLNSDVYSDNGRIVLLERGSEAVGEYAATMAQGQRRLFLLWTRVKTPTGVVINLNSPAADALGTSGLVGVVDNHWWDRLGAAFMLSLVQDGIGLATAAQANTSGAQSLGIYQHSATTGNRMAELILQSTINIKPTLYKNQGDRGTIFVARDLDFSTVYELQPH
ncbi:MAG: type IV secretion system protein VirB10 [Nitrospira sp.]|nr:type IV secretion system protein VirB10 [Nitrospira sp.]MDH4354827.1 type IV secretion system protein VirB10 [Nitrospira sp.]MDH5317099.1 type IV secretion system protein VirB10 [Nitrospira sp.]